MLRSKIEHLEELLATIITERTALSGNLIEEVQKTGEHKQTLMDSVEQTVRQSKTLLEHLKQTMPEYDQKAILDWCDPSGELNHLRDQISEITSRCQAENQRNGIQVRQQSQYVHTALNILRGEALPSAFYEASGEPSRVHGARSLGKA
ncbi:MAG: flagellar protein FlgN [Pseudomonadales bacterium]|jgi:flagellar biosynthesis/type III secretory pathway chaperone|nr:flagellar protein FlgN [Pseudomonadales bacterium]